MYQNTLIKPDGNISVQYSNDRPYFHTEYFNNPDINGKQDDFDKRMPGNIGIHTMSDKNKLTWILIAVEMKPPYTTAIVTHGNTIKKDTRTITSTSTTFIPVEDGFAITHQ